MSVRVIFSRNHSLPSLFLRAALWSPWSHVALVAGETVIEASSIHGVRERPLADFMADATKVAIIELPGDADRAIAAARSQIGKPYDWRGILGIGFRRRWQDQDAWSCSELVAWAIEQSGVLLFRTQPWRVTPQMLYAPIFGDYNRSASSSASAW
jgi:hypothetical protein